MMRKRKLLLGTLISTMFITLPSVNAYTFGVGYADTGEGGTTPKQEDFKYEETVTIGDTTTVYTCTYNYDVSVSNNITINGYNNDDKPIMETSLSISEEDRILSGTSIGLNIYETKKISWKVTKTEATYVTYQKKQIPVYYCDYSNKKTSVQKPILPSIINSITLFTKVQKIALNCNNFDTYTTGNCEDKLGCTYQKSFSHYKEEEQFSTSFGDATGKFKTTCENKASNEAKLAAQKHIGSSYKLELSDSNDINGKETEQITGQLISSSGNLTSGTKSGSATYVYAYKKNRACINVKTSKVTYKTDNCTEEEIEIKNKIVNGLEHWHYFIPLNAKNNQSSEINLLPSGGGILVSKQCLYVMNNNPVKEGKTSYIDLIIKTDGTNFKGDYSRGEKASADIKEINKNGCKLTSKIKINTQQRFYNEVVDEDGNITFKGFNFYYKPIDIINPFPNGLTDTSIWYNWNNSDKKNPNLTNSYEKVTYIAQINNASVIRDYTKKHPYTSWDNMYTTGVSQFIESTGIVRRYANRNSFSKLGCGPSNADWSECKQ